MPDLNFRPSITTIIISLLLIGTIAVGSLVLPHYFEFKEVEVSTGFSRQANEEPLLAAKRYLTEFGYQVESIKGLDFFSELPPTDHTIILQVLPADLPESFYNTLAQWVRSGGHLITGVGFDSEEEGAASQFLAKFKVTVDYSDWWDQDDYNTEPVTLHLPGETQPLLINSPISYPFTLDVDHITFSIPYNKQQHLLAQINAGKGRLTVSSLFDSFSNWNIGEHNHALLLSRVVESTDSTTLWINDNFNGFKGLFTLIWENYKWVVVLLAALLLLWLRYASVRLGPLENLPDTQSNNFAQHLLAVARFHFRHGNTDLLLAPTREKIIKSLIAGKAVSDDEVVKQVASRSKLPETQVQQALFGRVSNNTTLTTTTIILRQLMALTTRQRH